MNLLFLAHPGSTHDLNWISFFSEKKEYRCFLIARESDKNQFNPGFEKVLKDRNIFFLGFVKDFSLVRPWQSIATLIKLRKAIRENNIQAFQIFYAEPNALWIAFKSFFKVPVILTCRGSDILIGITNAFKKKSIFNIFLVPLYKKALREADYITVTSESQKKRISELSGRLDKVEIIRTGVNLEEVQKDTTGFLPKDLEEKPFIFFPRAMRPVYNHEFSLEAIELMPEWIKKTYTMVFVDAESRDQNYVKKINAQMASIKDVSFLFLPMQKPPALYELYKNAALVIMNPLSDGSPVSAMEAMVCKTPVILPNLDYDKELFNNESVFFFFKELGSSLASLIEKTLAEKENTLEKVEHAAWIIKKKANRLIELGKLKKIMDIYC